MSAVFKKRYTLEEYLELDRNSEERYEYFNGEVFAMTGGTLDHGRIGGNVYAALRLKLKREKCEVFNSDTRVKVPAGLPYRYPDVTIVCGAPMTEEVGGQVMLLNPVSIVEVLSQSTVAYDLGEKFTAYQSIDTFREYLLIAQDRPHVIQYTRQAKRKWLRSEVEGLGGRVRLESVGVTLTLAEIYARVKFKGVNPKTPGVVRRIPR